jgi:F0F1-type ATP synthase assembly protein I
MEAPRNGQAQGTNSLSSDPQSRQPGSPELQKAKRYSTQAALALELPFTIVGAMLVGGVLGYFLDHWLHTKLVFTFVLGLLGFAGGLKEVLRRLAQSEK